MAVSASLIKWRLDSRDQKALCYLLDKIPGSAQSRAAQDGLKGRSRRPRLPGTPPCFSSAAAATAPSPVTKQT